MIQGNPGRSAAGSRVPPSHLPGGLGFSARLRRWYRKHRRDLPWRRTFDPYAIWISEVMLQQTTVAAVTERFVQFLERFPTVERLGAARERDVLAEWSGLGYYARARNLHRGAKVIASRGGFPLTAAELAELPGIGAYTAAAVASIAFGERVAVLDGNVARVLARLFGLPVDAKTTRGLARLRALADGLLPARQAGDHNQALMELGATVCLPRAPRCAGCPAAGACRAFALGTPERFPKAAARKTPRRLRLAAGVAFRRGRLVVVPDEHLVKGHLNVPVARIHGTSDAAGVLAAHWRKVMGEAPTRLEPLGTLRHSVLERRYVIELFEVTESAGRSKGTGVDVVDPGDLSSIPHGGLLRKIVERISR